MGGLLNLLKAMRVERTVPVIAMMLLPIAISGKFVFGNLLLMLSCVSTYAIFGLHNAIEDGDCKLPKYAKLMLIPLLAIALLISLFDWVVLIQFGLWVVLGYMYNTIARKILFGDAIIISFTHFILPMAASAILVGLETELVLKMGFFLFFIIAPFANSKNLKGIEEDKKNGYATITTKYSNGKKIIVFLLQISFLFMLLPYFVLDLGFVYLIFLLIIYLANFFITKSISQPDNVVSLLRLILPVFVFGMILDASTILTVHVIILFLIMFSFKKSGLFAKKRCGKYEENMQ